MTKRQWTGKEILFEFRSLISLLVLDLATRIAPEPEKTSLIAAAHDHVGRVLEREANRSAE